MRLRAVTDSWNGKSAENGIQLRLALLLAFNLVLFTFHFAQAQQPPATNPAAPQSIEDEVFANLQSQKLNNKTLAELKYPEDFLRRVADRIIRESFERRFRIVVDEDEKPATQPAPSPAPATSQPAAPIPGNLRILTEEHVRQNAATSQPATANADKFSPAAPGFQLATDAGEHALGGVRLQLTRASDWLAPNDGGALDVARQLLTRFDVPADIHIESKYMPELRPIAAKWAAARTAPLTLLPQDEIVAQWAQDNAKCGWVSDSGGKKTSVWLLPRFATRGDIGGTDLAGETRAADRIAATGVTVLRSRLLFQGGNLTCVRDPKSGRRLLFIGEAEIARNLQWGWSRQAIIDAFRTEMGVDRCIEIPAIAYHLDLEMNFRVVGDRLVAFVVDAEAGRGLVLDAGIAALQDAGLMDTARAETARKALTEKRPRDFMNEVGAVIMGHALEFGAYPKSLADKFAKGPADSGVGNFLVFLHAMDSLLATSLSPEEVPQDRPGGYLRAIRRNEEARATLHKQLRELGVEVVKVPAISNGDRGINPVNCIHTDKSVLVPVWGGIYSKFDEVAITAYRAALGPKVEIVPILTSETQRRGGGLHCAVSAQPIQ